MTLLIPNHVARTVAATRAIKLELDDLTWDKDGVDPAAIPDPVGYRILVQPIEIADKIGSVLLADQTVADARHLCYVGRVVKLGATAYKHPKFMEDTWCKIGDYVVYGRYAGQEVRLRGRSKQHSFRFVNDDEIMAIAADPTALVTYV
jgi:co-chaperonin GroES (HSP10)